MKRVLQASFMAVPAICLAFAVYFLFDYVFVSTVNSNPLIRLAFNFVSDSQDIGDVLSVGVNDRFIVYDDLPDGIEYADGEIPVISYGTKWALLNIEGWETKDIPVYFGDSDEILTKGAGQWNGSYFCGLGKNCVLSAHVMTWFYEIEDTEPGSKVTMQTIYGTYIYEVSDKFVFDESDADVLYTDYGADTLLLYTCYPRSNGLRRTSQRAALICTLKEGKLYKNRYEN